MKMKIFCALDTVQVHKPANSSIVFATEAVVYYAPVLHVGVFDLAVVMTIVSWHHSIAAGCCSCGIS